MDNSVPMTAVLAIEFPYQVIVIADARVSWEPKRFNPHDNLQKIYPLGPTGVVGFAGSIAAAKAIFGLAATDAYKRQLPSSADHIPIQLAEVAREAFSRLPNRARHEVHLMFAGVDYSRIGLVAENLVLAPNIMTVMSSPDFEVRKSPRTIRLGYAERYPLDILLDNRRGLVRHGTSEEGRRFQGGVVVGGFAPTLAKYAPDKVGGLFTVAVATARGVGWWPHGLATGYRLEIKDGRFIQVDDVRGRRIPLKTILEINPYAPEIGDLRLDTPGP